MKNKTKKALLVIDTQQDFMPRGSLPVADGDKIVPVVNGLLSKFDLVIFTKDWHPEDMEAFASQHEGAKPFDKNADGDVLWPNHCVQGTPGADLHSGIDLSLIKRDFYIFKKGIEKNYHPYSGFGGTELGDFLRDREVEEVFIVGLALDYCVKDTAVDATNEGFRTTVVLDGCKAISSDINPTLEEFYNADVNVIESWELPLFNLL